MTVHVRRPFPQRLEPGERVARPDGQIPDRWRRAPTIDPSYDETGVRGCVGGETQDCLDARGRLPTVTPLTAVVHLPLDGRYRETAKLRQPLVEGNGRERRIKGCHRHAPRHRQELL